MKGLSRLSDGIGMDGEGWILCQTVNPGGKKCSPPILECTESCHKSLMKVEHLYHVRTVFLNEGLSEDPGNNKAKESRILPSS